MGMTGLTSIDLSNNSNLNYASFYLCENIEYINIANGNNCNLMFDTVGCSNLVCIQIDEGFEPGSCSPWWWFNPDAQYSTDCSPFLRVKEEPLPNTIKIYPNPAKYFVNIKSDSEITQIQIIDMQGKLVKTVFSTNQLDIRALPAGVYVVRVETSEGIFTEKVRKE